MATGADWHQDPSADVNEFHLLHGTSSPLSSVIAQHGFNERVAAMGGLYSVSQI